MAAYVVADETITDEAGIEAYAQAAVPTIAQYGGRLLVASDYVAVLEGDWQPKRLVVLEFDSEDALKRWYESPEYAAAKPLRLRAATSQVVQVAGGINLKPATAVAEA